MNNGEEEASASGPRIPAQRSAILDLLTALEYDSAKKVEDEIVARLLELSGSQQGKSQSELADALTQNPGLEPTFFAVMDLLRPFVLMVEGIYEFLSSTGTTVSRRASKFLISREGAEKRFTFDLSNFPHDLFHVLIDQRYEESQVELRLPGLNPDDTAWSGSRAQAAWRAVDPVWDSDFYDGGFHLALSYAKVVLTDPEGVAKAQRIVEPILDRLAAICEFAAGVTGAEDEYFPSTIETYLRGEHYTSTVKHTLPRTHVVTESSRSVLLQSVDLGWREPDLRPAAEALKSIMKGFAMSINVWLDPGFPRKDLHDENNRHDWFTDYFGQRIDQISAQRYLEVLELHARDYTLKLDQVAPTTTIYHTAPVKRLIEFLNLPFWRQRWFLYELWTVVLVLRTAESCWPVELLGLRTDKDGIAEWHLPGASARDPIAQIGDDGQVECWAQHKTYHPDTNAGLEPDLRLTTRPPESRDLVVIENKDRALPGTSDMTEILTRYVGGTDAPMVWLINYETFRDSSKGLGSRWPDRDVRVISGFKPGAVPDDFAGNVIATLRGELDEPATRAGTSVIATLIWDASPKDLDLHAWIRHDDNQAHVGYGQLGGFDELPYARLDRDVTDGFGPEVITVDNLPGSLVLAVHAYSLDGKLSGSRATVTVQVAGKEVQARVPSGSGSWWYVMTIDEDGSTVDMPNLIVNEPPFAF